MKTHLIAFFSLLQLASVSADTAGVATGVNRFGLELHRRLAANGGNLVTSPWSIESALAMTYAGASGKTKEEMARVLHFPDQEDTLHAGFAGIAADLKQLAENSAKLVENAKQQGGPGSPIEIRVANRLFGQKDYPFIQSFLDLTASSYDSPLERMDFKTAPEEACKAINLWVEKQTRDKIKDLIPPPLITRDTALVLTNAIYLNAPWDKEFRDEPAADFRVDGKQSVKVPALGRQGRFGYVEWPGAKAVTVPYAGGGLQFVLLVPDEADGLATLEKALSPERLREAAKAPQREIHLHFPSFKLEPERVLLAQNLIEMGMPTAFDQPQGSADFSRMGPRTPDEYLFISHVIHKAFIAVDKHGTEAAAATAVVITRALSMQDPSQPLEIRVDRPFAFAVQHRASGACLFLGRVTDPR